MNHDFGVGNGVSHVTQHLHLLNNKNVVMQLYEQDEAMLEGWRAKVGERVVLNGMPYYLARVLWDSQHKCGWLDLIICDTDSATLNTTSVT